jgi:hypothetical protein
LNGADDGQLIIANVPPGAAPQFAAAVDAATASTSVPFVYAHGVAFPTTTRRRTTTPRPTTIRRRTTMATTTTIRQRNGRGN